MKAPKSVDFIAALPRSPVGKVLKKDLRATYWRRRAQDLSASGEVTGMSMFTDKVVVITGAGSGIGRALAQQVAGKGARLALSDINAKGLDETLQSLPAGAEARGYTLDVSIARGGVRACRGGEARFRHRPSA